MKDAELGYVMTQKQEDYRDPATKKFMKEAGL
jgi:hypothetical protein